MASILVVSGPHEGEYYPLGRRIVEIGRDEACPIQIVDETASRRHAQIRYDGAAEIFHALDLESANGMFINDRKVTSETPLADGDVIRIGVSELLFSSLDFPDGVAAFEHVRQHPRQDGERAKSTVIAKKSSGPRAPNAPDHPSDAQEESSWDQR